MARHIADLAGRARQGRSATSCGRERQRAVGGLPVTSFIAPVSVFERPRFTWVPKLNGFTRTEDTGLVLDPATRGSAGPADRHRAAGGGDHRRPRSSTSTGTSASTRRVVGTGTAQVFTGGREFAATWTQGASGPPQYTLSDGSPAPIAPGEVWISLVPIGQPATVS